MLEPRLEIDPLSIEFGNVQVGTSAMQVVLLRNTGNATLSLEGVSRGSPFDDSFTFDLDRLSIPPNGVGQLAIRFSPADLGEKRATLVVQSSDQNVADQVVSISGTGVTTTLLVDPQVLSFGNVAINTTKRVPITLSNRVQRLRDPGPPRRARSRAGLPL